MRYSNGLVRSQETIDRRGDRAQIKGFALEVLDPPLLEPLPRDLRRDHERVVGVREREQIEPVAVGTDIDAATTIRPLLSSSRVRLRRRTASSSSTSTRDSRFAQSPMNEFLSKRRATLERQLSPLRRAVSVFVDFGM